MNTTDSVSAIQPMTTGASNLDLRILFHGTLVGVTLHKAVWPSNPGEGIGHCSQGRFRPGPLNSPEPQDFVRGRARRS